jgi:hypothetical protein
MRGGSTVGFSAPATLLKSAFGDAWQQPGFKLQVSAHKDGTRIASKPLYALDMLTDSSCCCTVEHTAVHILCRVQQ